MPPKPNPTLYSVSKTFMWFAITSLALLACLVAVVWTDSNRDWKQWQKKFMTLKVEKAEAELKNASTGVDSKKLAELENQHKDALDQIKAHQAQLGALAKEADAANSKAVKAKSHYQDLKQYQDSYRYYFEEYRLHKDKRAQDYQKKFEAIKPEVSKAKIEFEILEAQRDEKDKTLAAFSQKEKALQKEIDTLVEEKTRIQRRLDAIKPTLAKDILNAPMIDFIKPTLQIQQIVLDNLQDDYHFAKVQKVDRCTTCHLGIDQKGFEDAPQPFRTHPKMDLYLSTSSPHPVERFGCTVCHGGNGHSVNFKDAAHTPNNEEQAKAWKKNYGWAELEKWDAKMLPN
jgi:predicted  nucleic acid-binding Zn-ribbon protein